LKITHTKEIVHIWVALSWQTELEAIILWWRWIEFTSQPIN